MMIDTTAVQPYEIYGIAVERITHNYAYQTCLDCKKPSLPVKDRELPHPGKIECKPVKFTITDHIIVFFDTNSSELHKKEKEKITKLLESFHPEEIEVIGYTDRHGSKEYNNQLALKRAKAVAKVIKELTNAKVKIKGFGKCCYQSYKDCYNRRVKVIVRKTILYKPNLEVCCEAE